MRGEAPRGQGQILRLAGLRDGGQQKRSGYSETQDGLPKPDALAAEALDETAGLLLEMGQLPQYLDWSGGVVGGGPHDGLNWQEQGKVAGQGLADPDPLAAEALDETAGLLLETGRLPRYLDWSEGGVGDGVQGDRGWQGGGVGGGGEEMRRQGKRADGEWDWHALRNGVVVDERGDVGFYDGSFVEDPWRGLGGKSGEGR